MASLLLELVVSMRRMCYDMLLVQSRRDQTKGARKEKDKEIRREMERKKALFWARRLPGKVLSSSSSRRRRSRKGLGAPFL